jgi:hypothetical protein
MDSEKPTLKPVPPEILICSVCRKTFLSTLRLNGKNYRSCDECRHKSRKQGAKFRSDYKQLIINLK